MSQLDPTLDRLLDQLFEDDARRRRKAAVELGKLGNPEAIADLVNVYNKDTDANVRRAAGEALREFRRIELKMQNKAGSDASSGPNLVPILNRARVGLGITLAVTLLINIVFIGMSIGKSFQGSPTPPPDQTVPSVRADLISGFKQRLDDSQGEITKLRKVFSVVQGMGVNGMDQNLCQQLPNSAVNKVDLATIDQVTYPDLKQVNELINKTSDTSSSLRTRYTLLCAVKDPKAFQQIIGTDGGASYVLEADASLNKEIPAAQAALQRAIDKPAPTVGPTFTPTTPPTATVPPTTPATAAPTSPATAAANPNATTGVSVATEIATEAGTAAAATYNLTGLHLESAPTYKYHVSMTTSGTYVSNKTFKGSLDYRVSYQKSPLMAQFEVQINEGNPGNAFFKPFAGPLYVAGNSTYVVVGNVLYEYGSVVSAKSSTTCRAFNVTPQNIGILQDIGLSDLGQITLSQTGGTSVVNGAQATHYVGSRHTGANNELLQNLEVYVSKNNVPVDITLNVSIDPKFAKDQKVLQALGLKEYALTFQYDLDGTNVALDIAPPAVCEGVTPK